jgi:hypothetical protein
MAITRTLAGWSHDSAAAALDQLAAFVAQEQATPIGEPKVTASQDAIGTLYLAECQAEPLAS